MGSIEGIDMAAWVMAMFQAIALFLALERYLVRGIGLRGLKG